MSANEQVDLQELAPAEVGEIDLYQHREKIYTRKIEGFFQRVRLFSGWPLLLGYFLLPWLQWDGRQAVLFDLPARKFYILGLTFWPQDFPMLAFLLIISAFALFTVTNLFGRIWCGYTCPQTVWTSIFMWLEQRIEGSRNQRIKLDKAPWSAKKIVSKGLKHCSWLFVALVTGITFIGYFTPIRQLLPELFTLSAGMWAGSWTVFFTLATYINAGWMREQVCVYMCPYARFQSVMFDQDTLIVSYDSGRGEPRGSRKRDIAHNELQVGDCIDCELCVQVCPTGIDIRHGLQYECIGCALCVDACDSVMDKMQYPRGLIRYTSEHELSGGTTRWLRPRVLGYCTVLIAMILVFGLYFFGRVPVELTALRDRTELYIVTDSGDIENIYTLHLANKDNAAHQFTISIDGIAGAEIIGATQYEVDGGEMRTITLRVIANPGELSKTSTELDFIATAAANPSLKAKAESRFMKPL
ncbi:MAG: cytochrome c oxidase accessory protein CcoG [Pseudomonadota bacterium]